MIYKLKEEFRDARISIPSLRLEVNRFNVNEYGELIMRKFPKFAHNIEIIDDSPVNSDKVKRSRTRKTKD